jgi:hypothetical protein
MRTKTLASASLLLVTFCAFLLSGAMPASAAPIFFSDRNAFNLAAGSGLSFESFEVNPKDGPIVTYGNLTFEETGGSFNNFTNTSLMPFFTAATTNGLNSIWYDDNGNSVANLTFGLASPITALGFDITSAQNGTVAIGGDLNTSLNLTANTPSFFGVIDLAMPLSTVTFSVSGGPEVGFDAVSYGRAIPEPAMLMLLSAGMIILNAAFLRKFRGQKKA